MMVDVKDILGILCGGVSVLKLCVKVKLLFKLLKGVYREVW